MSAKSDELLALIKRYIITGEPGIRMPGSIRDTLHGLSKIFDEMAERKGTLSTEKSRAQLIHLVQAVFNITRKDPDVFAKHVLNVTVLNQVLNNKNETTFIRAVLSCFQKRLTDLEKKDKAGKER